MRLWFLCVGLFCSLVYQTHWEAPSAHATPIPPKRASGTDSVSLSYRVVGGVPMRVVYVDLNNPAVRVSAITSKQIGKAESIWDLLARAQPTAAITGTYFCATSKIPVGDIVIEGERVHFGGVGTALCITYDNQVRFIRQPLHRQRDWSNYRLVMGAGPRLLKDGQISLYPPGEGFRDKRVYASTIRTAVGVTRHNKLVLVTTTRPATLRTLARAMRHLGVTDAIALDGGGSSTLYYRRTVLVPPKRKLTNLLVVYEDPTVYEERIARLKPNVRHARYSSFTPRPSRESFGGVRVGVHSRPAGSSPSR
ncbi:MAG: phosphodiester glycosidase family protein [Fimbriimonadales bacterium]